MDNENQIIDDTYLRERRNKYANLPITDQLDLLWHDIDNGLFGEDIKSGDFYMGIKSIKDKCPKPE